MSFISFLKAVGNDFKKGLPVAIRIAQAADVGISIENPALGGIIGTSIQTVLNVEQKAQAVAAITGSTVPGPAKLAEAVNTLYPAFEQIFGQYGVKIDNSHVTNYVNAIVAALNAFPALPAPPPVQGKPNAAPTIIPAPPVAAAVVPDVALSTAG